MSLVFLSEKIKGLEEFQPDMSFKQNMLILKLIFNTKWSIIKPENDKIAYAPDENIAGLHWYVTEIDNIDELFQLIEMTISVNKEMEKKLKLYQVKVKELQDLFVSDVPYESLVNIQFIIPEINTPKKRGRPKKGNQVTNEEIDVETNIVTNIEVDVDNNIDSKIKEALK